MPPPKRYFGKISVLTREMCSTKFQTRVQDGAILTREVFSITSFRHGYKAIDGDTVKVDDSKKLEGPIYPSDQTYKQYARKMVLQIPVEIGPCEIGPYL
jgi:hypothetical protein